MREVFNASFFFTFVANHLIMAKKKTTKKAFKETVDNKAEKVVQETKEAKYNGSIIIDGISYRMGEAKARIMVKEGKAKFA